MNIAAYTAIKKLEKTIEALAIAEAELAHTVRVIKQSQDEATKKELEKLFDGQVK